MVRVVRKKLLTIMDIQKEIWAGSGPLVAFWQGLAGEQCRPKIVCWPYQIITALHADESHDNPRSAPNSPLEITAWTRVFTPQNNIRGLGITDGIIFTYCVLPGTHFVSL